MRTLYIPASETFVFEQNSDVVGFYSLHEDRLAAIFVLPELQGQGIGKQLLAGTHSYAVEGQHDVARQ
ncbi:MAG: GNAT family N-acetyltransferase, partial [Spirochaetales bacterium]|nr:GNAT family N-acetyltransferase [Spirochaetales bacterium]